MSPGKSQVIVVVVVVVVVVAALGAIRPVAAGEGRIPIFASTTIVADGKYIVTRNITGSPGGPVLLGIMARHADVDLNGFTLDNTGTGQPVIAVGGDGTSLDSVTVRNGILVGGGGGHAVAVGGSGSYLKQLVLEDLRILSTSGTAIIVRGNTETVAIRRNIVSEATGTGLWFPDSISEVTGVISDNSFHNCGSGGIVVTYGSSLEISNNRIERVSSGSGIELDQSVACIVEKNIVHFAFGAGINLNGSYGNLLRDNDIRDSSGHGIHLDTSSVGNILVHQSSTHNQGGDGIFVESSGNYIQDCILHANQGAGLRFSAAAGQNTYGRNTARQNFGVGVGACALLFPPNSCDAGVGNTSQGGNLIPGPPVF